jgi:hypothetical protein
MGQDRWASWAPTDPQEDCLKDGERAVRQRQKAKEKKKKKKKKKKTSVCSNLDPVWFVLLHFFSLMIDEFIPQRGIVV